VLFDELAFSAMLKARFDALGMTTELPTLSWQRLKEPDQPVIRQV
jgi:hypothetical protein